MNKGRFDALKTPAVNKFKSYSKNAKRGGNNEGSSRYQSRRNIFPILPKKKMYACTQADFPQLAASKTLANVLDFAKVIPSDDTKNEVEEHTEIDDTPPGWVRIYRENGKIQLDHNTISPPPSPRTTTQTENMDEIDLAPLTEMVERWKQEKIDLNDLVGDISPYWNAELD